MLSSLTNWAGNVRYNATAYHFPQSVEEVCRLVAHAGKVKALGSRHSFSLIADTDGEHVSVEKLNRVVALDSEAKTVTIESGVRYGELCRYLTERGYALPNLASLPHISVAGACATATHGSGDRNGCLSTSVRSLELVAASGDLMTIQRGDPAFEGAVVHLGALGVVVRLTLDVIPSFNVHQYVYERMPLRSALANYDAVTSSAYSVSLFTDWSSDVVNQVWLKSAEPMDLPDLFGAARSNEKLHPIQHMSPENCTDQLGLQGTWDERLPHFRFEFTPSSGSELQSEYIVPRTHAPQAIEAVASLREAISPHLHISEIRTVAADEFWLSPFYRQESVGIHFTWKDEWDTVRALMPRIEEALRLFNPRPHWGKLHTMVNVAQTYPRAADFKSLMRKFDPDGKFRNGYLDAIGL